VRKGNTIQCCYKSCAFAWIQETKYDSMHYWNCDSDCFPVADGWHWHVVPEGCLAVFMETEL
jgi:hypothetical protein